MTAFVRAEAGTIHIEVVSTGRMPVTLRKLELWDHLVLEAESGPKIKPTSRWALAVPLNPSPHGAVRSTEISLLPTEVVVADFPISVALAAAGSAPSVTVVAWAGWGDDKSASSKPIQIR